METIQSLVRELERGRGKGETNGSTSLRPFVEPLETSILWLGARKVCKTSAFSTSLSEYFLRLKGARVLFDLG